MFTISGFVSLIITLLIAGLLFWLFRLAVGLFGWNLDARVTKIIGGLLLVLILLAWLGGALPVYVQVGR